MGGVKGAVEGLGEPQGVWGGLGGQHPQACTAQGGAGGSGTSSKVVLAAAPRHRSLCPRRDVAWLGECDAGCLVLAELLGWKVPATPPHSNLRGSPAPLRPPPRLTVLVPVPAEGAGGAGEEGARRHRCQGRHWGRGQGHGGPGQDPGGRRRDPGGQPGPPAIARGGRDNKWPLRRVISIIHSVFGGGPGGGGGRFRSPPCPLQEARGQE